MSNIPDWLMNPVEDFSTEYEARRLHGGTVLEESTLVIVGLARNCASRLQANLFRLCMLTDRAKDWRLFIAENDSEDDTKKVIGDFVSRSNGKAKASMKDLGRKHRPAEFAGPRTEELAEYRAECQEWVRRNPADYTIIVDWDAWGGWSPTGAMTGLSYLATEQHAYGMASVSLLEHPCLSYDQEKQAIIKTGQWVHYDCWALRLNSYWDDYGRGVGGWKHNWLPPIGSPPVRVCSAFGGFCIYKTDDYLRGQYSGEDCEHVPFHRSIEAATGRGLYLNPSQRTVMQWIEPDAKHGNDSDQPVH